MLAANIEGRHVTTAGPPKNGDLSPCVGTECGGTRLSIDWLTTAHPSNRRRVGHMEEFVSTCFPGM